VALRSVTMAVSEAFFGDLDVGAAGEDPGGVGVAHRLGREPELDPRSFDCEIEDLDAEPRPSMWPVAESSQGVITDGASFSPVGGQRRVSTGSGTSCRRRPRSWWYCLPDLGCGSVQPS